MDSKTLWKNRRPAGSTIRQATEFRFQRQYFTQKAVSIRESEIADVSKLPAEEKNEPSSLEMMGLTNQTLTLAHTAPELNLLKIVAYGSRKAQNFELKT
jgi:hypothetical protein